MLPGGAWGLWEDHWSPGLGEPASVPGPQSSSSVFSRSRKTCLFPPMVGKEQPMGISLSWLITRLPRQCCNPIFKWKLRPPETLAPTCMPLPGVPEGTCGTQQVWAGGHRSWGRKVMGSSEECGICVETRQQRWAKLGLPSSCCFPRLPQAESWQEGNMASPRDFS